MASNSSRNITAYSSIIDLNAMTLSTKILFSTYCIVGVPLNLWILVAILTSVQLRSSLRNKVVCGLLLSHLLELAVVKPFFMVVRYGINLSKYPRDQVCRHVQSYQILSTMENSVANWTLVCMMAVLLAKHHDVQVPRFIPPRVLPWLGTSLAALPWCMATLLVPVLSTALSRNIWSGCAVHSRVARRVFIALDCFVVLSVAVCLLVAVLVTRRRRFNGAAGGAARGMKIELIGRGTNLDDVGPYVALLAVAVLCDLPLVLMSMEEVRFTLSLDIRIVLAHTGWLVSTTRELITPAVLMLMADLRERVKTWRPWYMPGKGIDLTVSYSREEA